MSRNDMLVKEYRDTYRDEHVRVVVALQIRNLRRKRGWSQETLAEKARTTQSAIARLENPNYGKVTIGTLLKLARVFDNGLLVKFVTYPKFLLEYADLSPEGLSAHGFSQETIPDRETVASSEISGPFEVQTGSAIEHEPVRTAATSADDRTIGPPLALSY